MQNVRLNVQGMSCGHCVNSIEGALGKLGAEAKVDLQSGSVTVYFDETKLTLDRIKETIEDQGYDVV
ncbi:copper chaperone [Paenibacillus nanensis]|uniref:Copper chaperone n=1 Tax=Paenibacillus nanensis TaxID=393251 RepID=A0A3A1UNK3_9BACL|nr:copper chaperone CopZ [Paenibacillus nanensis]RIX50109.1 copper chaperone [Paenibacillus nanensis]